jgi:hypothetical protein
MLIGFLGKKGHGKDTCCDYFVENYNFTKHAFAKPLKDGVKVLFNLSDDQLYNESLKDVVDERWNKSPRQLLQWMGTDVFRNSFGEDFWLKHMESNLTSGASIVIADVRFQNEIDLIRKRGGIVVKVIRPLETKHDQHISELGIDALSGDYEIMNDGSIEELHQKLETLYQRYILYKRNL